MFCAGVGIDRLSSGLGSRATTIPPEPLHQPPDRIRPWCPQSPLDRLLQPIRDIGEGGGIGVFDEVAGVLVLQNRLSHEVEVVVANGACRGGEGEQVIHRRRDLEGPLVAVALHALDPLGVHHPGPDDAADLFLQRADDGPFGARVVVVIDRALLALQHLDRRGGPSLELVVIVAVEQIVFAVVLVLDDGLDLAQPLAQPVVIGGAFPRAIGVSAPFDVGPPEVGRIAPEPLVDHRLEARAAGQV